VTVWDEPDRLIADSSAWIEMLRQRESPADLALSQALNDPSVDVMVPEPVQAEVLIHARIDAPMLHHDRDFVPLLDIAGVTVAPGSLGA